MMSEFEAEVKKAEKELEQSLVPIVPEEAGASGGFLDDEFLGDLKMQAQDYGQRLQDAAAQRSPRRARSLPSMRCRGTDGQ